MAEKFDKTRLERGVRTMDAHIRRGSEGFL